jgi:hypothetical protein
MIYSWDKFLKPLSDTDTNIQIMDNNGNVTYTINPYSIINVQISNNQVKVGLKSSKVVIIPFSSINESKLALPRIKQMIDSLQKKSPLFVNNEIKNYVNSVNTQFFYQSDSPIGTGSDAIKIGSFWFETDDGQLYVYIYNEDMLQYGWWSAAGIDGPIGPTGADGPIGPTGADGPIGPTGADGLIGPIGPTGADGPIGPTGADGLIGPIGPTGADGLVGPTGATGSLSLNGNTTNGLITLSSSPNVQVEQNLTFDGITLQVDGNIIINGTASMNELTVLKEVSEVVNSTIGATSSVVNYDFSTGTIFYHSSANQNFTANFINVPSDNNRATTATIILSQGSTAYIPTSVEINNVSQSIKWSGGTASGSANKVDIIGFTFIRTSSSWSQVLGQINPFN